MANKEQELQLWSDWNSHRSHSARNKLLKSLDPLLHKQVNKFATSPIPRTALETEARMLALNAFDTYDPTKAQLNTHVTNHLKHLQRYVLNYQNVGKIPEHRGLAISKFQNTNSNLNEDLGREPNATELADALSWSVPEVERMQSELRADLSIRQLDDDDEGGFFDYTMSQSSTLDDAIEFIYYDSSEEDKKILEYMFGIKGERKLPVSEIALQLNKTETYVRTRLKNIALKIKEIM